MKVSDTAFRRRPLAKTDAAPIAELIGDWQVVRWLSGPTYPYSKADAEAFLGKSLDGSSTHPERTEAIEVDGRLAGVVGIDRRSQGFNIGYWLGRAYWGHGVMTRAAAALTRDFFANSNENHLMSGYFSGNMASWTIQRKLGFEFVEDGLLMNRAHGKRLPHILTRLTRARFETSISTPSMMVTGQ